MAAINRRAWLTASGIGIAAAFLIGASSIGISMLNPELTRDPQAALASPAYLLIICIGLFGYVIYPVVGLLYAWLARRNGTPLSPGPMALGGFASVLSVIAFQFVLSLVNTLVISRESMDASIGQLRTSGIEIPPGSEPLISVAFLCVGMCFPLVIGGGLGAGAAAIYTALVKDRAAPAA